MISERTKAEQCEGCGERPDVIVKSEHWIMLLCDPCLEEQMCETEKNDFEITILPEQVR